MRTRTVASVLTLCLAAMLVATCAHAQTSRRDPVHNVGIAMPSPVKFSHTDHFAREIYYFGEGVYHTTLRNTTGRADTFRLNVVNEIVPDGLGSFDWLAFYCDTSGACHFGPWDYVLEAGESEVFDVHLIDNVGTTQGMALTTLTATWNRDATSVSFATFVDLPSILLVDDDAGASYETYLEESVDACGYEARTWDADGLGRPKSGQLSSYRMVLWTTANGSATYIDAVEEQKMMDYLDGGGNLLLASMEYLSSQGTRSPFITDYLRIADWVDDTGGGTVEGVAEDPISHGMTLPLDGGPFPSGTSDSFVPASPAVPIFTSGADVKGLRVDENGHRAVFLGFPIEDVSASAPFPSNRTSLVERIIDWFTEPRSARVGDLQNLVLEQNVPNPFNPRTEIAFTVPEDAGLVTLTVHNVNGQLVRTLVNDALPAGPALAVWDGADESGRRMASGIYLAGLQAGGQTTFRKMMLLK
jgi:hypothetical protein